MQLLNLANEGTGRLSFGGDRARGANGIENGNISFELCHLE